MARDWRYCNGTATEWMSSVHLRWSPSCRRSSGIAGIPSASGKFWLCGLSQNPKDTASVSPVCIIEKDRIPQQFHARTAEYTRFVAGTDSCSRCDRYQPNSLCSSIIRLLAGNGLPDTPGFHTERNDSYSDCQQTACENVCQSSFFPFCVSTIPYPLYDHTVFYYSLCAEHWNAKTGIPGSDHVVLLVFYVCLPVKGFDTELCFFCLCDPADLESISNSRSRFSVIIYSCVPSGNFSACYNNLDTASLWKNTLDSGGQGVRLFFWENTHDTNHNCFHCRMLYCMVCKFGADTELLGSSGSVFSCEQSVDSTVFLVLFFLFCIGYPVDILFLFTIP